MLFVSESYDTGKRHWVELPMEEAAVKNAHLGRNEVQRTTISQGHFLPQINLPLTLMGDCCPLINGKNQPCCLSWHTGSSRMLRCIRVIFITYFTIIKFTYGCLWLIL